MAIAFTVQAAIRRRSPPNSPARKSKPLPSLMYCSAPIRKKPAGFLASLNAFETALQKLPGYPRFFSAAHCTISSSIFRPPRHPITITQQSQRWIAGATTLRSVCRTRLDSRSCLLQFFRPIRITFDVIFLGEHCEPFCKPPRISHYRPRQHRRRSSLPLNAALPKSAGLHQSSGGNTTS